MTSLAASRPGMQSELAEMIKGAWAGSRRGHWQTWCEETWSGCQLKQRCTGLKGLHMAPNHTWSNSSLCFQVLASTNIMMLELEKQQKFLQRSPHPLRGLNIFPVWKSSLGELLIWISQCSCQEPGGSEEEHQLAAWTLPVLHTTSLSTCLTLHKHKITALFSHCHCLSVTQPLHPVLPALQTQAKQEIPDPWAQTPKPHWQLLSHSKTNPFSHHPWHIGQRLWWGKTQKSVKHFYLWSWCQYSNSLQAINPLE